MLRVGMAGLVFCEQGYFRISTLRFHITKVTVCRADRKDKLLLPPRRAESERHFPRGICIKVCLVGEDRKLFGKEDGSICTWKVMFQAEHRAWEHVRRYGGCDQVETIRAEISIMGDTLINEM